MRAAVSGEKAPSLFSLLGICSAVTRLSWIFGGSTCTDLQAAFSWGVGVGGLKVCLTGTKAAAVKTFNSHHSQQPKLQLSFFSERLSKRHRSSEHNVLIEGKCRNQIYRLLWSELNGHTALIPEPPPSSGGCAVSVRGCRVGHVNCAHQSNTDAVTKTG